MIRAFAVLLIAGLLLGACGSIDASSAMATWVSQSGYRSTVKSIASDAQHAATALRAASTSSAELHTVCGVLLVDTESANASLPTPDDQVTNLLSTAYTDLGAGANECYGAAQNVASRARALTSLTRGDGALVEASARIASVATP